MPATLIQPGVLKTQCPGTYFTIKLKAIFFIKSHFKNPLTTSLLYENLVHLGVTHVTWKMAKLYDDIFLELPFNYRNHPLCVPRSEDILGAEHTQLMFSRIGQYCLSMLNYLW